MDNTQIIYYSLKLLFSGLVVYGLIEFSFTYIKMPKKETLAPLLLICASSLYIISDTLVSVFTIFIPQEDAVYYLLFLREFVPLLFLFIAPYYLGRIYELTGHVKTINRIIFLTGIITAPIIMSVAIISPDMFIKSGYLTSGEKAATLNSGQLLHIRNILLMASVIYSIIIILIYEIRQKSKFPIKKIFIGLVIVSYIFFNNLYVTFFSKTQADDLINSFPYISLSLIIFIIFMTFGSIEMFVNYSEQYINISNGFSRELFYDPNTGIHNTISFRKDLQSELSKSEPSDGNITLIIFDIDDFQNINESYGESVGNELLKQLSLRMMDNFKQSGVFYRIGGDEFAFLLPGMKTDTEAIDFASKIISSMRNPFLLSNEQYLMTVSIGILFLPRDGKDLDTIMKNAYSTIRTAKKNKNTYAFFSWELMEGSARKIHTVNLLRNSISKDEFVLYYHPVVDTDGRMEYAEALLRCTNKDPKIGGPGNFIPLIEKAGLMKDLDNLVIRKAFYDMEMKIKNRFGISINLSANQLIDPAYGKFLSQFAKQHGIEPKQIILEITESTLVKNILLAKESLSELKKNGFLIAIDDFGKGFSSLSYLAELPLDILKIDLAFVHAVPGDARKEIVAKNIMEIGKTLNLMVIAEGFELPEQVEFFKNIGCTLFQGFYFSKPMPLQELLKKYPHLD